MTQYIEKFALVAEIERKIRTEQGYSSGDAECGYRDCAREILSFLDTLEVKEVEENIWKPSDGDDLPEIDREVVALRGLVDPTATDSIYGYQVVFAHRPNYDGWDGKSIATGKTEHYIPKTYGRGGWNIPDIVWWLDLTLPNEE